MFRLIEASTIHIKLYYDWANDPTVRSQAIHTNQIPWEEHKNWFSKKIGSDSMLLILLSSDTPVGQIRFDPTGGKYLISYSIGTEFRGNGFGKKIISEGIKHVVQRVKNPWFLAQVKESNIASIIIFQRLDFTEIESVKINGEVYRQFEWKI